MLRSSVYLYALGLMTVALLSAGCGAEKPAVAESPDSAEPDSAEIVNSGPVADAAPPPKPLEPLAPFVNRGLDWLLGAQHENGGWGAGSHNKQNIRDAHAVRTDPATTALVGLAIIRADGGKLSDAFRPGLLKATDYLMAEIEAAPEGPKITKLTGTQPQTKLGPFVDTAMAAQFLARILPLVGEERSARIENALDVCVKKLQGSQQKNGSWGGRGGWAPVLQSSMGANALELAQRAGRPVSMPALKKARSYQQDNLNVKTGKAAAGAAAGVELYSMAGSGRASAPRARKAQLLMEEASESGLLPRGAPATVENLRKAGAKEADADILADAVTKIGIQSKRLKDERLLKGFGSNGGEEYLSYMLTSESLAIGGGDAWAEWDKSLHERMEKIQSADGSWTGHHCITSPVFCTAAVVQALTVNRDVAYLRETKAEKAAATEKKQPVEKR